MKTMTMRIGDVTAKLAHADDLGEETREAIRAALKPVLGGFRHQAEMMLLALDGPDPEFALYSFIKNAQAIPEVLNGLEVELAHAVPAAHRRAA